MSGRLVGTCLREARARTPGDLIVLVVIAEHSRDDGFGATLNVTTIAKESRLSTRQVKRNIAHLRQLGDIAVVGHRGKSNQYLVTPGLGTSTSPLRTGDIPTATGDIHVPTPGTSATGDRGHLRPKVGTSARSPRTVRTVVEPVPSETVAPPRSGIGAAPVGAVLGELLGSSLNGRRQLAQEIRGARDEPHRRQMLAAFEHFYGHLYPTQRRAS